MSDAYISVEKLHVLHSTQPVTIIDVRSDDEYRTGHIPGAIHLPADALSSRLDTIPSDRPVIAYCSMRHRGSSRSERVVTLLRESGYDAKALEGGIPAWESATYPVERSANPSER